MTVSSNYRELDASEVEAISEAYRDSWQDERIPERQHVIVTSEMASFGVGQPVAPYDAFIDCMNQLPAELNSSATRLLDIGAASGYYSEVLDLGGFDYSYAGIDYSEALVRQGRSIYPGIDLQVGNAERLPYPDEFFDIVVSGACIMHVANYQQAIWEAVRVSKRYVIFHRTPIRHGETKYFEKEAYGIPCVEIHFGEDELMELFDRSSLRLLHTHPIYFMEADNHGHSTYLLEKAGPPHFPA